MYGSPVLAGEIVYAPKGFAVPGGSGIAVAPFQNLTAAQNAGEDFASDISESFSRAGIFRMVGTAQFKGRLVAAGGGRLAFVDRSIAQIVGRELGVNYVVFGSVVEYGYELADDGSRTIPIAGVDVRIVNVDTGTIVFAGSFVKEGSTGTSLYTVAKDVADAVREKVMR